MRWHGTENGPHTPTGGTESASSSTAPGAGTEAGSTSQATGSQTAGAEAGGSMGGGHSSASVAEATEAQDHAQPAVETHEARPPSYPEPDLSHDPLAGLHSDHLRDRLHRDAFRSASGAAQDSAIAHEADRASRIAVLPEGLRDALSPFVHVPDVPLPDHSPAARAERIEALGGEIPAWAKGDLQNDPKLLKMLEQPAASRGAKLEPALVTGQVRLRGPSEAPTQPAATVVARLAKRALAEMAKQPPIQPPIRAHRTSSGDREM